MSERTAWWGTCIGCLASMVIYPHPDRDSDLPGVDEWDIGWPASCPVCGSGSFLWDGSDPASAVIRG